MVSWKSNHGRCGTPCIITREGGWALFWNISAFIYVRVPMFVVCIRASSVRICYSPKHLWCAATKVERCQGSVQSTVASYTYPDHSFGWVKAVCRALLLQCILTSMYTQVHTPSCSRLAGSYSSILRLYTGKWPKVGGGHSLSCRHTFARLWYCNTVQGSVCIDCISTWHFHRWWPLCVQVDRSLYGETWN